MRLEDYTEPKLILLRDLLPGGGLHDVMPKGVMNLAVDGYKRERDSLAKWIGALELAYGRGYRAGQIDAGVDAEDLDATP